MTSGMGPDSFTNFTTGASSRDDVPTWQKPQQATPVVGGMGRATLAVAVLILLVVLVLAGVVLLA